MNYRTLAKGALALSLSFIVASASASTTTYTDTPLYGATFESAASAVEPLNDYAYATNTLVTAYTATEGGATYGWLAGATDESKIIAAHGGQALQLNTDAGTLTNKLAPTAVATPFNTGIAASGAYIETEAKFVASDTLDPGVRGGTDDTKFALYAYCDEDAGTTTNLVVYHAYARGNTIDYTNEVFSSVFIDTGVYTKLRVEMKKIEVGGDTYNAFSVSVGNGSPLTSELAISDGCWFLTVEDAFDDDNKTVTTINFKGTGEVDNLEVGTMQASTTYAIDWTASQNVVVSNATAELTAADTNFTAGATLSFYPTVGSITNVLVNGDEIDGVFYPLDSYTYTVGTADAIVSVYAGEQVAPFFPRTATVGQDGSAAHPFEIADVDDIQALKEAFEADASWRSLSYKLVADIDATDLGYWDGIGAQATANSGLNGGTLDGNGHIITNLMFSAGKYRAFFNRMDNATIKNLTIHVKDFQETNAEEHGYAAFVGNMNGSVLENCTAIGTIGTIAKPAMHTCGGFAVKNDSAVAFVNCTNHISIVCALTDNPKIGGIIGLAQGVSITNCWNDGNITIAVKGCHNAGNGAGGLVGYSQSNALRIHNSGNAGIVQSTSDYASHTDNIPINVGTIFGRLNSSTATITGGTIAQADAVPAGYGDKTKITGLAFATVDGNVATFVSTLESNNTYKVMLDGATATYAFAAPGTISFDTAMYTPTYAITAAEGLDLSDATDGTVKTYTATAPTPTYTVSWAGSENVVVSNATEEILITTGEFEEGAVITFYPTEGSITNVLLNGAEQRYETPFVYEVTADAQQVLLVYAGEAASPSYTYPEGGAIEDSAVVGWLTAKGFTPAQVRALGTNAKLNECYLLNCDITQSNAGGSITITGIEVGADGVVITVALTRTGGYEGGINGTLALLGASDLTAGFSRGALESVTLNNGKFSSGNTATATFTGTGKTFFKAFIAAPAAQ